LKIKHNFSNWKYIKRKWNLPKTLFLSFFSTIDLLMVHRWTFRKA
jgi:hypothetical protein